MITDYEYKELSKRIYRPQKVGEVLLDMDGKGKYNISNDAWKVLCVEESV